MEAFDLFKQSLLVDGLDEVPKSFALNSKAFTHYVVSRTDYLLNDLYLHFSQSLCNELALPKVGNDFEHGNSSV